MSEQDSSDFTDEFEEDNESTMAEEEALDNGDANEELRLLNEENEMSVEELRRRYYGDTAPAEPTIPNDNVDQPGSSSLPSLVAAQPLKNLFTDNAFGSDEEEDEEYIPKVAEYWKKEIRIGEDYQAHRLPDLSSDIEDYQPTIESTALWQPKRTESEPDKLRDFLNRVNKLLHERERELNGLEESPPQANRPPKSTAFADNEDSLYALMQYGYDPDEAIKHAPFPPANGPRITAPKIWRAMNSDEIDAFESGYREYGKNFYLIQKNELPDRTVGELVNFYYVWKKTERHDMFIEANRALGIPDSNTKTIDPMDILADQQLDEVNGIAYTAATALLNTTQHSSTHKTWLSVQQHSTSHPPQPKQP